MKDNSETRINLTKIVHELINCDMTIDECIQKWWKTPYAYGGFRLTTLGAQAFDEAKIEYSIHPFKENGNSITFCSGPLVRLSILMPCPFYIIEDKKFRSYIRVYDDRTSTLIYLYGDIDKYLYSLENQ